MHNEPHSAVSERSIAAFAFYLIFAVALFGAGVAFGTGGHFKPVTWDVLEKLSIGTAVGGLVGSRVVPDLWTRRRMNRLRKSGVNLSAPGSRGPLLQAYLEQFIIDYALLAYAALFGLIVTFFVSSVIGLFTAVLCLLVQIARFPFKHQINQWINRQTASVP
jgi:hypothetical protein